MQQLFGIMIVFGSVFGGYAMMGGQNYVASSDGTCGTDVVDA